ncbi:MAG: magnesium/cobalt transporter CorA [Chloroflexi bacterium]|uniref:Magnesium transport protein CorA n=1 Tax=Candidatus Chlorohelix allophototropha TaxID=3003348 RepID=A0A8T7LUU9_9CHLR|nr:magnesium/cobalt transporter CorA [Chloroflexota bacterium]WJW66552.1 magnesium/cobalt transporter CorA [Chloroflexota bacterium L227-S17]
MIKALVADTQTHNSRNFQDLDKISDLLSDSANFFWLDLSSPSEEELNMVAKEFNFHHLAMEDVTHRLQRPKIEEYENYFLGIFYSISLKDEFKELVFHELAFFIGANYLVTIHYEPIPELAEAEARWKRNNVQTVKMIGPVVYAMLDTLVDNYFPIMDKMVDYAEELEDDIFQGNGMHTKVTGKLLELKKLFLQMRRIIAPERDILNVLTNRDNRIFGDDALFYFRDVYDHLTRVTDTLDLYRDQIGSTMEANLSVASNDLNSVMRTLTAFSIILMTDALISGIYGMNFENIPELKWSFGYYGALSLMVGITVGLVFYFKRKKWL